MIRQRLPFAVRLEELVDFFVCDFSAEFFAHQRSRPGVGVYPVVFSEIDQQAQYGIRADAREGQEANCIDYNADAVIAERSVVELMGRSAF